MQEGPAGAWATTKIDTLEKNNNYGTYTDFISDFTKAFITQNEAEEALQALDELKQKQGESVITFNAKFQTLADQANATEFVMLQEKYLKGISPRIAREIIKHSPQPTTMITVAATGKGLYDLAVKIEAMFRRLDKLANVIGVTPTRNFQSQTNH